MSGRRTLSLLSAFLCLLSSVVLAQTSLSGAVAGSARDAQQAAILHAQITLKNLESGEIFATLTGDRGAFRIEGLPPGSYALKAANPGFTDFGPLPVTVEVGRITEVAIHFAVAGVRESIEVHEQAPAVNTTQPDFATNIDDAFIDKLPINGRRWSNFALLAPTATMDSDNGAGDYGLISFRGISGLANNNTIDGADNNQAFFSEERGRTRISYVISQESVREFQVNTSNFSAEYGRAAGATINAVTRSGGNRMHGTAFYFIRDNQLGATNSFTQVPVQQPDGQWTTKKDKPLDRRQQFGGSLGGPIIKNKLFYFASFDAQRRDYPAVAAAHVPSALFAKPCVIPIHYAGMNATDQAQVQECGDNNSIDELYTLTRNVMPLYTSDATAIAAFQAGQSYLANLLGEVPRTADHQIALAKLDYHINPQHTLGLVYNRQRWSAPGGVQSGPVVNRGIASFAYDGVKVDMLIARLTSNLGHSTVNQLRYSWSRDFEYESPQSPAPGEPVGPSGFAPQVSVMSYSTGFSFGAPSWLPRRALPNESRNQIANTLSWVHNRHTFKFGFDANRVVDEINDLHNSYGAYYYNRRDNFIADLCQWQGEYLNVAPFNQYCPVVMDWPSFGAPTYYRGYSRYVQGYGSNAWTFHTFDGAVFAQDDWRVAPRLTLSFGLRYEFQLLPAAQTPNPLLAGSQKFPNDLNNLGPRFGFALALTGDGKTSLRGGYGLYYGRISNSMVSSALTGSGTLAGQRSYSYKPCYLFAKNCLDGPLFPNVYPSPADPFTPTNGGNVVVISPKMQNSQIHQFDLVLEREIAPNTVLSASYLVSLGRELPNYVDINLDPASRQYVTYTFAPDYRNGAAGPYDGHTLTVPVYTGRLDGNFQSISELRSNVNSFYHALVVQLNRTSTRGLGFRINYTLARAQDDGQGSYAFPSGHNHTLSPDPFVYMFDNTTYTISRPDYGTSNYEIRQRLSASLFWSPRPLPQSHGLLRNVMDHWTLAPIIHLSSGRPFSEHISGDAPIGTCSGCDGFMGTGGVERLPFLERNSFHHRPFFNTDLRISRRWTMGESGRNVELMAEVFNLFNHRNVTERTHTLYRSETIQPTLAYDSNFATPVAAANTIYREREIQLGLRVHF
jgi:carboxypeptidase family protein